MIIKTLLGTVVLIMFKIFVSYGQDVAQQQLQIVIKDTSGKALEGVYMVNKTQQYLITSSNEEGYCYYDKEVVNDTDSVVFLCLGFEERVIGGAELITTQELRLIEKVYELENITVKSVKPDILLKKAATCMQKHAEKVKKNYNYYGKAQYIKITECHGKAVEYRNLYGVFFTSGNIPKKDVLDEDYRWDFVPAFGAQSLSWTADGKDTLIRRRLVNKNNKKVSGNYDAGNTKFFLLMRSIMLYGPLFTNLKYYDFQLTDNRNGYTYRFRTKPANSLNKMRIRCYGTLTIDPETARLRSLKLDYVDYNMCYLVRQTEWIRSPYVTIAQMQFNYAEDGLPYVENCEQKTIWEKQQKYEKPDRAVLGKTPSRRGAAKHGLVEKEFFKADTYHVYPEYYRNDSRFYSIFRLYNLTSPVEYDEAFEASLPELPAETVAKKEVNVYMDIKEQFKRQSMKCYYFPDDFSDLDATGAVSYSVPKGLREMIIDVFVKGKGERLVIQGEGLNCQVSVR